MEVNKEAVRNCNKPADITEPDLVTFLGYEWTQVGNNGLMNTMVSKMLCF